ncbi:D-aminoacyl-tRNA deacylase [Methylomonas sp. CM2]|uniref:D-aminoacyl-tRNA deacylase n=1 Tax=Methylomonas sp. CM2 TaxID=3417647 RepID=UPI003CF381F2
MITVIQRVRHAEVVVDGIEIGRIGPGILALVGVEKPDTRKSADRLLERILSYRIFADAQGKMNLSLRDIDGGLLLVPQFTLAADTDSGNRPSFTAAAPPELGRDLFAYLQGRARDLHPGAQFGRFGADMQVSLTNDGPVTFTLRSADKSDR